MLYKDTYSIRSIYTLLLGSSDKVTWKRVICNNPAPPKCNFITWLAILGRLATCDKLQKIGVLCDSMCSLCNEAEETQDHLLFQCKFAAEVWGKMLQWMGYNRQPEAWLAELQRREIQGSRPRHMFYRMGFSISIYLIWKARNYKRFQNMIVQVDDIVKQAQILMFQRCIGVKKMSSYIM